MIKDIYQGAFLEAWGDDENVSLTFYQNGITLSFVKEDWEEIKKELKELLKVEDKN